MKKSLGSLFVATTLLLLVMIYFGPLASAGRPADSVSVEQWSVFELTLKGPASGNPFTEVELSARFSQNDRAIQVSGFYDGDGLYKIRFMPQTAGEWRYETNSNRSELKGQTGVFTATKPTNGNHGPVHVADTFHFAYADGSPYFQLGTTCYYWTHRSDAQEQLTLKTLAATPFNKIRMCVFPEGRATESIRFFPFTGTPPGKWDTSRFDPAFFRHLEERVGQLRDLGIEADLILFHPYDRTRTNGFNSMDAASDDRYVRYLVARLAAYRNVWWSLANEYDLNHDKTEADWDRLFQVVQSSDPYGHLRSIHHSLLIYNNTLPWVTHASIQNGAAVLDPERAMLYRDVYRKPIVFDEVKYEGDSTQRWGKLSGEEMVLRFWNGLIAGTYVGHGEIFTGGADSWLSGGGELRGQSVPRLAFLKKIMEAGPAEGINPIDKWQDRRTGGKPGEYYLVYFGRETPTVWPFELYKNSQQQDGRLDKLQDGLSFQVEIIDTWNMTIRPVPGVFVTKKRDNYVFVDKAGRSVPLPGRPYMALRIRRLP